jgi:hypothetical protein
VDISDFFQTRFNAATGFLCSTLLFIRKWSHFGRPFIGSQWKSPSVSGEPVKDLRKRETIRNWNVGIEPNCRWFRGNLDLSKSMNIDFCNGYFVMNAPYVRYAAAGRRSGRRVERRNIGQ